MDETALMHAGERTRKCDRDSQRFRYRKWSTEQSIERFAAGVLEHQRHSVVAPAQLNRPRRPRTIEFGLKRILMFEPLEGCERGVCRGDQEYRRQAVAGAPPAGDVTLAQGRDRVARKLHRDAPSRLHRSTASNLLSRISPVKTKSVRQKTVARISSGVLESPTLATEMPPTCR